MERSEDSDRGSIAHRNERDASLPIAPIPCSVFERRWERMHRTMAERALDALVVTALPNIRWLTDFTAPLGLSADRSWIAVLPASGEPIAVMPLVVANDFEGTHVARVETWNNPDPNAEHDGLELVTSILADLPRCSGRVGLDMGRGVRPTVPWGWVEALNRSWDVADCTDAFLAGRSIKAPGEIERIERAAMATCRTFETMADGPSTIGATEVSLARRYAAALALDGAATLG
ncbi:MAG: aminopeptidase P family N-terminal domain-containing protein [Pseudomonadota bacterium]